MPENKTRYSEGSDIEELMIDRDFAAKQPEAVKKLSKHQLIYSVAGLLLGFACIIGGIVLFLNGLVGSTSWTAKFFGAESSLNDGAPGAVLFIVGLFIVLITRYTLKVKN